MKSLETITSSMKNLVEGSHLRMKYCLLPLNFAFLKCKLLCYLFTPVSICRTLCRVPAVMEKHGKSWDFDKAFSRPEKFWILAIWAEVLEFYLLGEKFITR